MAGRWRHCFSACSYEAIREALGFDKPSGPPRAARQDEEPEPPPKPRPLPSGPPWWKPFIYHDVKGTPVLAVLRKDKGPKNPETGKTPKTFRQFTPAPAAPELWLPGGIEEDRPLYHLPKIDQTPDAPVTIVEGEKCVEASEEAWPDRLATTFAGGVTAWRGTDYEPLRGRGVSLLADDDEGSHEKFRQLAYVLVDEYDCPVRIALPEVGDGDVADWIERDGAQAAAQKVADLLVDYDPTPEDKTEAPGAKPKAKTERHLAQDFVDKQSEMYRYDADARVWRRWSGGRWSEAKHHIMVDVGGHLEAARTAYDMPPSTASLNKHKNVLELAQAFGVQEFNPNPNLLGLPWGEVLDTTTGTTATLTRGLYVTRSLPESIKRPPESLDVWDTDWATFVKQCLIHYEKVDRMRVAVYLQRWAGVALTANCDDEQALYLYGVPGTGKGTFSETLLAMMGEYGYTVSGSRIVGENSQHSQWKAGARDKRLIVFDEVPPGRWRDDELDPLISGQMIEANRMRENSIQFRSQAHLIFTGNSRPSSKAASGIWRRLRIVQFQNKMDEDAKNPGLRKKFREQQLDDVFAWALAGLRDYLKSDGRLITPGILRETTAEFRKDADQYPQWIDDSLERGPGAWTSITDLYDSLKEWWSANNSSRPPSKRAMTMALGDLGFETTREGHQRERGKAGLQRR